MEKYELEQRYDEDEIDLTELLKTIFRERFLVLIMTVIFFILSLGFYFYKENRIEKYGVNITLSSETVDKINQLNDNYKNISFNLERAITDSFKEILNQKIDENVRIFLSTENNKIEQSLNKDNGFFKIVDEKNKSYEYFTKIKKNDIDKISEKIKIDIKEDEKFLNNQFKENINFQIQNEEKIFNGLKIEVEDLNSKINLIVKENFSELSKENLNSNLMVISPIIYIKYKEKVNLLNNSYLLLSNLKEVEKISNDFLKLSGENNISIIKVNSSSENNGLSGKLILVAGIVLGLFFGMFVAIIKEPLIKIIRELKEEK